VTLKKNKINKKFIDKMDFEKNTYDICKRHGGKYGAVWNAEF